MKKYFKLRLFNHSIIEIESENQGKNKKPQNPIIKFLRKKKILNTIKTIFVTAMIFICLNKNCLPINITDITEVLQIFS